MASGDTLVVFTPYNNEPPTSSFATLDTRNNHVVLDFDGDSDKSAVFSGIIPQHYGGATGVTVYLHFSVDGTSGDTDWDIAFERIGEAVQDIDSDGFATALSNDGNAVPATSGHVDIVSQAFTTGAQMDSLAVGESFRLKITRDGTNDDSNDDANLLKVEIRET
jgi:hypothetical protein